MNTVTISNRKIGEGFPVFIIAEAGCNHNGDIDLAKQLIDLAAEAGADAVKFQTFIAGDLVTKQAEKADYQKQNTGKGKETQREMLKRLELSFDAFREVKACCELRKILFLSTPFDPSSADLLEELEVPAYKIASGEITNLPFLRYIASKGKPVILSTGMSTLGEVEAAREVFAGPAERPLVLLHCTSAYPAPVEEANLKAMETMQRAFVVPVGFSDHTPGTSIALAAVARGASVLEKHFTLDRGLPGPDHRASLDPHQLKKLVMGVRAVEKAVGDGLKRPSRSERSTRLLMRKSIVAATGIRKDQLLTEGNLAVKRPGSGISPLYWDRIIGSRAARNFERDELIRIDGIIPAGTECS